MKKKDKKVFWVILLILLISASLLLFLKKPTQKIVLSEPKSVTSFSIVLNEQNNSQESGIAVFEARDDKTLVKINVVNAPVGVSQPAHLHVGTCKKPVSEMFNIENVLNGKSETLINIPLKKLLKKTPFVLNIHESVQNENIYTSCGTISTIK